MRYAVGPTPFGQVGTTHFSRSSAHEFSLLSWDFGRQSAVPEIYDGILGSHNSGCYCAVRNIPSSADLWRAESVAASLTASISRLS
jgi:hypothetical protein